MLKVFLFHSLGSFYAALRRALIVAIVLRAGLLIAGASTITVWLVRRIQARRRRLT